MKNFLILTTALVMVGAVSSGAMAADKVKLSLGGFANWWVVATSQDDSFTRATGANYNDVDIKGDTEIYFLGETTLDNGLKVGVRFEFEAGGNVDQATDPTDTSFIYLESAYGRLNLGATRPATNILAVTAADAAANWNDSGIATAGFTLVIPRQVFSINPGNNTYNTTQIVGDDKSEKISYMTPSFNGLTLGASYSPNGNEDNRGPVDLNQNGGANTQTFRVYEESYGLAANYTKKWGDVGVKTYVAWMDAALNGSYLNGGGSPAVAAPNDINMYAGGVQLSYAGFTLGGSYRHNDHDTGVAAVGNSFSGDAFDVGLMYTNGSWSTSIAYYQSAVDHDIAVSGDDEITFYQASGNYKLSPGIDLRASVGYGEFQSENRTNDADNNEGWYLMSGIALAF